MGLSWRQGSRYTDPAQRDRHIQLIEQQGCLGWQRTVNYGRSLGEVAMYRYKKMIGRCLHSADTEDGGQSCLQGHQHHDQPRHAGLPPDRLTPTGKSKIPHTLISAPKSLAIVVAT